MPTNEQLKQQYNVEAQMMKDRLIDTIMKLINEFSQDWNRVTGKLQEIKKEEEQQDKLNKKLS